jgi:hypothetical protein
MSKISNVRFLPVDISEGKDYNRKEVVKLFPFIEAALASKRFNGATMDLRKLGGDPESESVTVTKENLDAFNLGREYQITHFVLAGFTARIAGEPKDFELVFIGNKLEYAGNTSFIVTCYTKRSGLAVDIVNEFRPDATSKGLSLSDWAKKCFTSYDGFVRYGSSSLRMRLEDLGAAQTGKLLEEVSGKILKEIMTELDESIKDLVDI